MTEITPVIRTAIVDATARMDIETPAERDTVLAAEHALGKAYNLTPVRVREIVHAAIHFEVAATDDALTNFLAIVEDIAVRLAANDDTDNVCACCREREAAEAGT